MCCPGCQGIHNIQIGGGVPGGVACSCPPECTTVKYMDGNAATQAFPTAENPVNERKNQINRVDLLHLSSLFLTNIPLPLPLALPGWH